MANYLIIVNDGSLYLNWYPTCLSFLSVNLSYLVDIQLIQFQLTRSFQILSTEPVLPVILTSGCESGILYCLARECNFTGTNFLAKS